MFWRLFCVSAFGFLLFESTCGWEYQKSSSNLDRVPHDIPESTLTVDLSNNKITKMYIGEFFYLHHCTEMNLQQNQLVTIQSGTWLGLNILTRLDLSRNQISEIPGGAFYYLDNCAHLSLERNQLSVIKRPMWNGLISLKWLDLSSNFINTIQPNSFIDLRHCHSIIAFIQQSDMFVKMNQLKHIYLQHNNLSAIGAKSFPSSLEHLELQNNKLQTISDDMFWPNFPPGLNLNVSQNPFHCNSSMCWIKIAQSKGWINQMKLTQRIAYAPSDPRQSIIQHTVQIETIKLQIECANFPKTPWNLLDFNCTETCEYWTFFSITFNED